MLPQLQTQLVLCMCTLDAECAPGCPEKWIGDTVCDESCRYSAACQYDAGDCDSVAAPEAPTSAGLSLSNKPVLTPAVLVRYQHTWRKQISYLIQDEKMLLITWHLFMA